MANSSYSEPSMINTPSLLASNIFEIKIHYSVALELSYPSHHRILHHESTQTYLFTRNRLLLNPEGPRYISERLSTIGLSPQDIETAVSQVLSLAREMETNPGPDSRVLGISIYIIVSTISVSDIIEESMQNFPRAIPASKEAIQKLERVRFQDCLESTRECTICLEEFHQVDHLEIVRVPCGHVYHQKCIVEWLQTSNICPLCRYQLPCSEN